MQVLSDGKHSLVSNPNSTIAWTRSRRCLWASARFLSNYYQGYFLFVILACQLLQFFYTRRDWCEFRLTNCLPYLIVPLTLLEHICSKLLNLPRIAQFAQNCSAWSKLLNLLKMLSHAFNIQVLGERSCPLHGKLASKTQK